MLVRKDCKNVTVFLSYCMSILSLSSAFLASVTSPLDKMSSSHTAITRKGVHQAIQYFLQNRSLVPESSNDVISDFFKTDQSGKNKYERIVSKIITANNNLQLTKRSEAKYSVNGEQIQEAHNFIISTRTQIKDLAAKPVTEDLLSMIREKIGQCLFVIQSFYSNTNWVNMEGPTVYKDFGVPGKALMPIATRNTATCIDCLGGSCVNNIKVSNMLTSGYLSGQDIAKLPRITRISGKCSHGGYMDATRFSVARGGINKETSDPNRSPMYQLHHDAAAAAEGATSEFLIGEYGILKDIGDSSFREVFNLLPRQRNSLVFVLDVSGSMADDVKAVLKSCTDMVTRVMGTNNEPRNYILSTFSDPESLTEVFTTTKGTEMISKLKTLEVKGGDDCPEYAMSGLIRAIDITLKDSPVYVFTDAAAKDCSRLEEVKRAAKSKNIKVDFMLTGRCKGNLTCVSKKKRSTGRESQSHKYNSHDKGTLMRVKRSISVYEDIAAATGGSIHEVTKTDVSAILNKLIKEDFPSSEVVINTLISSRSESISVHVDSSVQLFKMQFSGASRFSEATLISPSGQSYDSTKYSTSPWFIISVTKPEVGTWTLIKKSEAKWTIKVTAQALITISYRLLETDSEGLSYPILGNPIADQNYTLEIRLSDIISNSTNITVALIDETGSEFMSRANRFSISDFGALGHMDFTMPVEKMRIHIIGVDDNNVFQRTSDSPLVPVSVQLRLGIIIGYLSTRRPQAIPYTISNAGDGNTTILVVYTDSSHHEDRTVVELTDGETKEGNFKISGASDGDIIIYTITVSDEDTKAVLQSLSNSVVFTDIQHPECTVLQVTGNCTEEDLNVRQCSTTKWETVSQVRYSGVNINNIYLSNHDASVSITYDNVTGNPINVSVSGSCCAPSVYINIIDTDSYSARCHFYFGDPYQILMSDTIPTETEEDDPDISKEGFVIIGVVCGVGCVLIVFILIKTISYSRKKRQYSLDTIK